MAEMVTIKENCVWKEVMPEPRGYYQLQGRYMFRNAKTGEFVSAIGYSTCTTRKCRGKELQILRMQAIDYVRVRLEDLCPNEWVLEDIDYEVWLKW